ncbi:AprI/Inh family metalloprotease inhibitor [Bosea sp. (in: a-proteobacteria)]|jgi:hypothetical protein|uniref:AprI/Inh family metalloprotease inhibitor n=1 Tax=Bosea sp. (in: a-proteobacteria) TaxID=1871050 RepID=UPI003F712A86
MTIGTANRHRLITAASLLPLLALTACAGSQRFTGPGPAIAGGPVYTQPQLQSAPPISSAPISSQPLPPPGGYPVASAPNSPGGLPPQGDPFFDPNAGAPPGSGAPPVERTTEPPTLRGGGGQVATLGSSTTSPRGGASSRDSVVGNWTAREATGGSCRVQLSSAPSLDLYRANAAGCSNRDLQKVNAWDYRDGEVYLYQSGGSVVARLRASDGGGMNGAVTKSGAALSLNR